MKCFSVTCALAGVAGCVLSAGTAAAQPPAPDDWSGPYVGLNLGADSPHTRAESSTVTTNRVTGLDPGAGGTAAAPPATFGAAQMDYGRTSVAGGGQAGYNWQMGHLVIGAEGDVDAQDADRFGQVSRYALAPSALTTGGAVTIQRFTSPRFTSTVRGRLGWAMGPVLVYGTGGLAIAQVEQGANYLYAPTPTAAAAAANPAGSFGPFANGWRDRGVLTGWTVGGGAEYRLSRALSVGAEYRHLDFGSPGYFGGVNAPVSTFEAARLGYGDDQVMAKLNFHF